METLRIGSYSEGTMRDADLIPTFLDALEDVDKERADKLEAESGTTDEESWEDFVDKDPEAASQLTTDLFDVLGEYCPEYCDFGASEGDGASFGCWPDVEALQEAVRDGEVLDFDKLDRPSVGQLVCEVNERGNVSLYRVKVSMELEEVWAIV